jgi:hypothetical protein
MSEVKQAFKEPFPSAGICMPVTYCWPTDRRKRKPNGSNRNYVLRAGDTMLGSLYLAHDPLLPLEAATKQYVDAVASAGGTFVDAPADGQLYGRQDNGWVVMHVDGGTY